MARRDYRFKIRNILLWNRRVESGNQERWKEMPQGAEVGIFECGTQEWWEKRTSQESASARVEDRIEQEQNPSAGSFQSS
jgi:hypothetical protein